MVGERMSAVVPLPQSVSSGCRQIFTLALPGVFFPLKMPLSCNLYCVVWKVRSPLDCVNRSGRDADLGAKSSLSKRVTRKQAVSGPCRGGVGLAA